MTVTAQTLRGWHAHIYFDQQTEEKAKKVIEQVRAEIEGINQGHMHRELVGPHSQWSCLLYFKPDLLGKMVEWLAFNRKGLNVLFHPITGNDLIDHRDRVFWLGDAQTLNLDNL